MSEQLKASARDFLSKGRYLQLATVTHDNRPDLRNIAYVLVENKIFFVTDRTTSKYKEILSNPNVACLISKDDDDWSKTMQLKISGKAAMETDDDTIGKALAMLVEKYPGFQDLPPDPNFVIMRIQMGQGALMDNTKGFFISESFVF